MHLCDYYVQPTYVYSALPMMSTATVGDYTDVFCQHRSDCQQFFCSTVFTSWPLL